MLDAPSAGMCSSPSDRQRSRVSAPETGRDRSTDHELYVVIRPVAEAEWRLSARAPRGDVRWCPSDAPSDRCCRRRPADRRQRRSSGGGWRRWGDGRRSRSARAAECAIPAAGGSAGRARGCRASRNPKSGCSNGAQDGAGSQTRSACRAVSGRPSRRRQGRRSIVEADVPANDEDRVARVEQRASYQPEIVRGILYAAEALARGSLASSCVPAE